MITVIVSGKGMYRQEGRTQHLSAGMIGIVLPDEHVGLLMADPNEPYDHLYCRFAGREAKRVAQRIRQMYATNDEAFFAFKEWAIVSEILLRGLPLEPRGTDHIDEERLTRRDAILAEALAAMEQTDEPAIETGSLTADLLRTYLQDHISEPTDLERVARYFDISKAHLCRVARKLLDMTLLQCWEQIKMQRAQLLLREPDLSVAQVARRVGYGDPFYFSKVFRRAVGSSPSQWRKQRKS